MWACRPPPSTPCRRSRSCRRCSSCATSQPLAALPSQLPNPPLHEPSPHVPDEQKAPAFAKVQALPHAPQLLRLVFVLASQPFERFPSQLPDPELHAGAQAPTVQVVEPFGFAQALPHVPQFDVVLSGVSHPVADRTVAVAEPAVARGDGASAGRAR